MNKIYFILFLFLIIINLLLFFRKVKENFGGGGIDNTEGVVDVVVGDGAVGDGAVGDGAVGDGADGVGAVGDGDVLSGVAVGGGDAGGGGEAFVGDGVVGGGDAGGEVVVSGGAVGDGVVVSGGGAGRAGDGRRFSPMDRTTTPINKQSCPDQIIDPRFKKDYIVLKNPLPGEEYSNIQIRFKKNDIQFDNQGNNSNKTYRKIDMMNVKDTSYNDPNLGLQKKNINYCSNTEKSYAFMPEKTDPQQILNQAIYKCELDPNCNYVSIFPQINQYKLYSDCETLSYNSANDALKNNFKLETYQKIKYQENKVTKCGNNSEISVGPTEIKNMTDDEIKKECDLLDDTHECNYIYKDYSTNPSTPSYTFYRICNVTKEDINSSLPFLTDIKYCDLYENEIDNAIGILNRSDYNYANLDSDNKILITKYNKCKQDGYLVNNIKGYNKTDWLKLKNKLNKTNYKTDINDIENIDVTNVPNDNKYWYDNTIGKNILFTKNQYKYIDGQNDYIQPGEINYPYDSKNYPGFKNNSAASNGELLSSS